MRFSWLFMVFGACLGTSYPASQMVDDQPQVATDTLDITDSMAGKKVLSLDLSKDVVMGDPYGHVTKTLKTMQPKLASCLAKATTSKLWVDIEIDDGGRLKDVSVPRETAVSACLARLLSPIDFGRGRTRMGLIPVIARQEFPDTSGYNALTWTVAGDHQRSNITVQRVESAPGVWSVAMTANITALGKPLGVGDSLRYNYSLVRASGASSNEFSLQQSTAVKRCLAPGETDRIERTTSVRESIRRGERIELSLYILAGACSDGQGRHSVGKVHLDWTAGDMPILVPKP